MADVAFFLQWMNNNLVARVEMCVNVGLKWILVCQDTLFT